MCSADVCISLTNFAFEQVSTNALAPLKRYDCILAVMNLLNYRYLQVYNCCGHEIFTNEVNHV